MTKPLFSNLLPISSKIIEHYASIHIRLFVNLAYCTFTSFYITNYLLYILGYIFTNNSDIIHFSIIINYLSYYVYRYDPVIYIVATYLPSYASMALVIIMAYRNTNFALLFMYACSFIPISHVLPLILMFILSVRNIRDASASELSFMGSLLVLRGSKVSI